MGHFSLGVRLAIYKTRHLDKISDIPLSLRALGVSGSLSVATAAAEAVLVGCGLGLSPSLQAQEFRRDLFCNLAL